MTVDRQAQEPLNPIKPRGAMVVALSLMGGLMLGILGALMLHFIQLRRETEPFAVANEGRPPRP